MDNLTVSIRTHSSYKTAAFRKPSFTTSSSLRNSYNSKRSMTHDNPKHERNKSGSGFIISASHISRKSLLEDCQVKMLEEQFEIPSTEVLTTNSLSSRRTSREPFQKLKVLEKMGFKDLIESSPSIFAIRGHDELKIRPSHFNVAELWDANMKKEFIHRAGYDEALKHLKKRTEIDQIKSNNFMSKPDKPRIMDENIIRKTIFNNQKQDSLTTPIPKLRLGSASRLSAKTPISSCRGSSSSPESIFQTFEARRLESIISQCDELFTENFTLKQQSRKMSRKSSHDFLDLKLIASGRFSRKNSAEYQISHKAKLIKLKEV